MASPFSSSAIRMRAAISSALSVLVLRSIWTLSISRCRRQVQIGCALICKSSAICATGRPAATRSSTSRRNSAGQRLAFDVPIAAP